jgi:hypothetical protein
MPPEVSSLTKSRREVFTIHHPWLNAAPARKHGPAERTRFARDDHNGSRGQCQNVAEILAVTAHSE